MRVSFPRSAIVFCVLFVIAVVSSTVSTLAALPEVIRHLALVLAAVMLIHLLDRVLLHRDFERIMRRMLRRVLVDNRRAVTEIARNSVEQTEALTAKNLEEIQSHLRRTQHIISSAEGCGMAGLYPSRKAAVPEIRRALQGAQKRIWVLGVALSAELEIDSIRAILDSKLEDKEFDLRILLLDALRSPAIFRTFIESRPEDVRRMAYGSLPGEKFPDVYCRQILYLDFQKTILFLQNETGIRDRVRYYAHSPSFWMLIVDDVVYMEPYTFGRPRGFKGTRLGGLMPVMKFKNIPGRDTYEVLVDHFEKLWLTSDIDIFQVVARMEDRESVLQRVFNRGADWLRNVYGTLYVQKDKGTAYDRRGFPRFACEARTEPLVRATWDDAGEGGSSRSSDAAVVDCSRTGLRLRFQDGDMPLVKERVRLSCEQIGSAHVRHMVRVLAEGGNGVPCLQVAWVDDKRREAGLQRVCAGV